MTKERIEVMRKAVLPFCKEKLVEINYEGRGKSDAEEFEKDFNELLNLAIKAIEQEPCEDAVSRQAVLDAITEIDNNINTDIYTNEVREIIETFPPVTPMAEIVTCKDCKHWKDSDGVYRRGIGAESKCPINIKEVRDGIFYCGKGERRE